MITRVKIVCKDEEGDVQGGMEFFHTPGNDVILYSRWEYRCSGNTYGPVNPDPIGKTDLLTYLIEGWLGQREDGYWSIDGESITDDYR